MLSKRKSKKKVCDEVKKLAKKANESTHPQSRVKITQHEKNSASKIWRKNIVANKKVEAKKNSKQSECLSTVPADHVSSVSATQNLD